MPKRILIVDDDPTIHQLLGATLTASDWRIDSAYDAAEALEMAGKTHYDLMVTDVRMPGGDGLDLLERVRTIKPDLKVIVMTGETTPEDIIRSIRQKAYSFVSKPFAPGSLADLIAQALNAPNWERDIAVVSARPNWITLRVRCKLETADRLVQFMREMRMELPEQEREDVATAFRELLLNAIEHGGQGDPRKKLWVSYVRTTRALIYYIQDPGKGFSFDHLAHAAVGNPVEAPFEHTQVRAQAGMRAGGFGILVARNLVDELIYNEKGNEVLLIKYYRPQNGGE